MAKLQNNFFEKCKHWFLNQPAKQLAILVGALLGGFILLSYSFQKPGMNVVGEADSSVISLRLHIRNPSIQARNIDTIADFTIVERVMLMMRECAQGHVNLYPLSASSSAYSIPAGQTKDFQVTIPRSSVNEDLLEKGSCNLYIPVRIMSSKSTVLGAIPFKIDTLKKYYMDVDLGLTD